MKNVNVEVINEITKRLVDKRKMVSYLMNLLCIGKESSYRRIKGQIPFTFQEVTVIARDLGFSIDKMLGKDISRYVFFDMPVDISLSPENIYIKKLEMANVVLEKLVRAEKCSITAVINKVPLYLFPFKMLFKFEYFVYLNSNGYIPLMTQFSDIEIIPQINDLQKKSADYFNRIKNIICVVDNVVLSGLIMEIQYYYRRKLISDEDLAVLQKELFELLSFCETILRTGENGAGGRYVVYYSHLNINTNCAYYEYDDNLMLQIWIYSEGPILIENNPVMCDIQKRYLDSLIRNSVQISKNNDVLRIDKFREAYNLVVRLMDIRKPDDL